MEYPYLGQLGPAAARIMYRPSLPIEIRANGKSLTLMAIVDSGSDITVMECDVARALGINLEKCEKTRMAGVTGDADAYKAEVGIVLEGFTEETIIPVVFVEKLATGLLLGQVGFFDKFKVIFDKKNGIFHIE